MYKNGIIVLLAAGLAFSIYNYKSVPDKVACTRIHYDSTGSAKVLAGKAFRTCNMFESTIGDFLESFILKQPGPQAFNYLDTIVQFLNLPPNFKLYNSEDIDNACAFINDGEGERYIVYNDAFFKKVTDATHTKWSVISIMAHEVGHHLSGHTLKTTADTIYSSELEADKFSGFVLANLGATLEESIVAIEVFGSKEATKSHPAKEVRIEAIKAGWGYAKDASRSKSEKIRSFIPDSAKSEISNREITGFLRKWRLYQNNKKYNAGAFSKYRSLYAEDFSGVRRALDGRTKYCDKKKWLKDRQATCRVAENVIVSYSDVKVVDKDDNGISVEFNQIWSTDRYEENGRKRMKIFKNSFDGRIYISYENLLHPETLYFFNNNDTLPVKKAIL